MTRHNCHTCARCKPATTACALLSAEFFDPLVGGWLVRSLAEDDSADPMPPIDSDGCPGWAPKEEA